MSRSSSKTTQMFNSNSTLKLVVSRVGQAKSLGNTINSGIASPLQTSPTPISMFWIVETIKKCVKLHDLPYWRQKTKFTLFYLLSQILLHFPLFQLVKVAVQSFVWVSQNVRRSVPPWTVVLCSIRTNLICLWLKTGEGFLSARKINLRKKCIDYYSWRDLAQLLTILTFCMDLGLIVKLTGFTIAFGPLRSSSKNSQSFVRSLFRSGRFICTFIVYCKKCYD